MSCIVPPGVSAGPKEEQASASSNIFFIFHLIWKVYQLVHINDFNISVAICVAGFSAGQNNEILQLAIPEKLLPVSEQVRHLHNTLHMLQHYGFVKPVLKLISLSLFRHFVLGETSK